MQNPNNKRHRIDTAPSSKRNVNNKTNKPKDGIQNIEVNEYSGVTAKPGPQKMRTKFGLKTQANLHIQNLKRTKNQMKKMKKSFAERKVDHIRQPKQKQNKKQGTKDDARLSKLINDYKNKLGQSITQKSKWYE